MSNEFDNRNELIRLKSEKIKQLQEEISERRRRPHRWLQKLYSWQREFMDSTAKIQVLTAANQALQVDTLLPTPTGPRRIGDLVIGDFVFAPDRSLAKVLAIPFEGVEETYKLTFSDGGEILAGHNHLWVLFGSKEILTTKQLFVGALIPTNNYLNFLIVTQIERVEDTLNRCITVSSEDHCFLVLHSEHYPIITHNCGKSSTMIKKTIEWATNEELWPLLWPERMRTGQPPTQFWYLYPSAQMALAEFFDKWVPLLPPKDDPEFGWKEVKVSGKFLGICFLKNRLYIYFKTYSQNVEHLQAGTAYLVVCDEEVPENIVPELQMRVHASNGYIIFGFTATLGQIFWREIVEERKRWKDAWVKQVPLWDCTKYEDGTPTAWTKARIEHAIANCTTEAEVQRRIYGRFVKDEGLKFSHYSDAIHMRLWKPVPKDWRYYVGIDWGVGANAATGRSGHPSGIVFVAVNPEYTEAVVERSWRGDGLSYTCQDLVELYLQMSVDIKDQIARVFYDWSAGDIGTVAMRRGLSFERADKDRERGVSIINSLLKMRRISFYRHHGSCDLPAEWVQGEKIHDEFSSLPVGNEGSMLNELADSIRYALISVPFDWDKMREIVRNLGAGILSKASDVDQHQAQLINGVWLRAGEEFIKTAMGEDILEELEFWNETFQD